MTKKIRAGIVGGAGYTGGELVRLLLNHPETELQYVVSQSQAGKPLSGVHADLTGETNLVFTASPEAGADVVFLCLPHGESKVYLERFPFLFNARVIDLSRDFRVKMPDDERAQKFVYGLPEMGQKKLQGAQYVANPGCFATAIQLALLPLAAGSHLKHDIHVNATTGSTGAGQSLSEATHFTWRNNNLSVYKAFEHEHLPEIEQSLQQLQKGFDAPIHFVPQRGAFTRGILASTIVHCPLGQKEAEELYKSYYSHHPFVHVTGSADIKQVTNTNKCFIQLVQRKDRLAVISVIDNLLKGASGQAVQNMNLLFGLEETCGLKLKANVF
jgi:N-acetyl-gamma-glutamyl-phosphate reductase